jgi:uncharacterized membrane protein
MRALIFALALAACGQTSTVTPQAEPEQAPATAAQADPNAPPAPAWVDARAQGVDFRAVGQEPGWLLNIYRENRITLDWDYGEHSAEFPLTAPDTTQEGATRYQAQADGHTIAVTIRRFPCNDGMSGAAFPSTVVVEIDGRTLNGCGRSV